MRSWFGIRGRIARISRTIISWFVRCSLNAEQQCLGRGGERREGKRWLISSFYSFSWVCIVMVVFVSGKRRMSEWAVPVWLILLCPSLPSSSLLCPSCCLLSVSCLSVCLVFLLDSPFSFNHCRFLHLLPSLIYIHLIETSLIYHHISLSYPTIIYYHILPISNNSRKFHTLPYTIIRCDPSSSQSDHSKSSQQPR